MGSSCCDNKSEDLNQLASKQSQVLWVVFALNLLMFGIESTSALYAGSLALAGDALDMFGDALTYAISIYAVDRGHEAKVRVSRLKAYMIIAMALFLLGSAIYRFVNFSIPSSQIMGAIGALALATNAFCLYLLSRHRTDDINMKSVWICSRNDIVANVSVILAAGLVYWTKTPWPDLIVGLCLTVLFLKSATGILKDIRAS